jgi:hypothetical protein
MSSQPPPRKPPNFPPGLPQGLPPGLLPLKLKELEKAELKQNSTMKVSSLSIPTNPSSSSDGAISPLSTDTIALSPLGSPSEPWRIMNSEEVIEQKDSDILQICSENMGSVTDRGPKTDTSKSVEGNGVTSGSKLFPSFSLPQLNLAISSASFFRYNSSTGNKGKEKGKEKGKGKEKEIESEREVLFSISATLKTIYYPLGYRGFLETHSEKLKFSAILRRIFGINTFADVATIGLFYPHTIKLFLEKTVLASESAVDRIAGEIKTGAHKNLLSSLCRYDRSMTYWVSTYDLAYDSYMRYMESIFFEEEPTANIYSIFEKIPQYIRLSDAIQVIVSEIEYKDIYEDLMNSFKKYEDTFSKERHLDFLKESAAANQQDIELKCEKDNSLYKNQLESINSDLENRIRREKNLLTEHNLNLVPEFTRKFKLKHIFFQIFEEFRNQEISENPSNMDNFPKVLPLWNKGLLCQKGILEIYLYFFAALCRRRIKFYDMVSGEKIGSIYINEKFISEFSKIKKGKDFIFFLQEKKKNYNQGLLEIVLYKTLEYINENTQIDINYSMVVSAALKGANAKYIKYMDGPFHGYGEDYFMEAIRIVCDQILGPIAGSSEVYEMEIEKSSSTSPKI